MNEKETLFTSDKFKFDKNLGLFERAKKKLIISVII